MPRFYFDTHDDEFQLIDTEGLELPDLGMARIEAAVSLSFVAQDELPKSNTDKIFTIHVRDESGHVVLRTTLTFHSEALPTSDGEAP